VGDRLPSQLDTAPPSPSLIFVHTDADDPTDAALAAAVANAALEGIHVEDDEQELIGRHQRGELSQDEFLAAARALAESKTRHSDD
jgi:hypothetical protein